MLGLWWPGLRIGSLENGAFEVVSGHCSTDEVLFDAALGQC